MIKVKAIILNIRDWREADRILTLYTEKQGKIEVLVRGAKKIKSKLAGFCQPFCILDLFLARGRNFYHLTGGEIIKQFKEIASSYHKLILVSRYFNLIDQLIKPEKPDSKIFKLIIKFLEKIEQANQGQIEILGQAFLIKFISFLGYQPELKKCLVCGRKSSPKRIYFNPKKGGVICSLCHQSKDQAEIEISKQILDLFQQLLYQEFSFWLGPIKIWEEEVKKVSFLIEKFLEWRG